MRENAFSPLNDEGQDTGLMAIASQIGGTRLTASHLVYPAALRVLLTEMQQEFCAHSWKKVPVDIAPQDLLAWENLRRPTTIHYYYQSTNDLSRPVLVAAASIADAMRHDSPSTGFSILARCYVRPAFRGNGLYRKILHHRLSALIQQDGGRLKAVHMGTADERVFQTITDRSLPWNGFVPIGSEDLSLGSKTVRVGGYLMFAPRFAYALLRGATALTVPLDGLSAYQAMQTLLAGTWSGPVDPYSWFVEALAANPAARDARPAAPIRELVGFCAEIPLVYAPGKGGAFDSVQAREAPASVTTG